MEQQSRHNNLPVKIVRQSNYGHLLNTRVLCDNLFNGTRTKFMPPRIIRSFFRPVMKM